MITLLQIYRRVAECSREKLNKIGQHFDAVLTKVGGLLFGPLRLIDNVSANVILTR